MQTKTKTRLTLLTALVGTLALGGTALARPGGGHGHRGHGGGPAARFVKMIERLDLTEEQEVRAVRLRRQLRKERKALRPQMQQARKTMMAEMAKDTPNASAIEAAMDRMAALRQQQAKRSLAAVLELHATLTPAQKAKLREHLERMDKKMDERRERKMRRGRGGE